MKIVINEKERVIRYSNTVIETPLLSVSVVTYQHSKYISQCLKGIFMQKTDFEFEILLGEDASTDGTRKICIEYAQKYPDKIRLFLHSRENNIKIEEITTDPIFLERLIKEISQGEVIADPALLDKIYKIGQINKHRKDNKKLTPAERYEEFSPWQKEVFLFFMKKFDLVPYYQKIGHDLSVLSL